MSGWIPLDKKLLTDIRFQRLVRAYERALDRAEIDCSNATALYPITHVLGALALLWLHADTHADEHDELKETTAEINAMMGWADFCSAMPPDWLESLPDGRVKLPNFHAHSGSQAKAKYLNNRRQANFKERQKAALTDERYNPNEDKVTQRRLRPDQTIPDQEKEKGTNVPSKKSSNSKRDSERRQMQLVEAELTPGLNRDAWQRWLQYRTEIRKPLHPASFAQAAHAMAALGSHAEQLDAVTFTIGQGWQGLQARKAGSAATPRAWSTRPTQESALAAIDAANRDSEDNQQDGFIRIADV